MSLFPVDRVGLVESLLALLCFWNLSLASLVDKKILELV